MLLQVCVVFVDGCWRLVDQHWGSQSVSVQMDPHWALVQDGGASKHKDNLKVNFSLDDTWFLIDPVTAVYAHLNENPQTQLLARPVTPEEFNEIAYLHTGFFTLGLSGLSHPRCVVPTADGRVTISLGLDKSRARPYRFYHNLYKWVIDPDVDRFRGYKEKEFSVKYTTGEMLGVHVEFPWIGKYLLDVEGEEEGVAGRHGVCQYLIQVETPCFRAQPLPVLPRSGEELGVTPPARALGLLPVEDGEHGIVSAPNGHAAIKFVIPNVKDRDNLRLRAHMAGNHVIRQFRDREGNVTVVTKVTEHGKHVLCLDIENGGKRKTVR